MKKMIWALLLVGSSAAVFAQSKFTALTLSPAFPKQNSKLSFQFNKDYSPLVKQPGVDIVVYQFNENSMKVSEPVITKKGTIYSGTVMLDSNTNCVAFGFSSGDEKDINNTKGYITAVYGADNKPVKAYYLSAYNLQVGFGEYLFGLPVNADAGLAVLEEGAKNYPVLKSDPVYFGTYLAAINRAKKKEAPELIGAELAAFEAKGNMSEAGYATMTQWYLRDKKKGKADSLTTAMKTAYPNGEWVKNEAIQPFYKEKAADKKMEIYTSYVSKYPPTEKDKQMTDYLKSQIASAYANEKNYAKYNELMNGFSPAMQSSSYNNIAWNMAEKDENIEEARKMAFKATSYAEAERKKPTEKKPDNMTTRQWQEQRDRNYAMYGDTYAFILYKQGDYKTAYPIAKEAATINKLKDAEYNERYAMLAEKTLPPAEAKKLIEKFVEEGTATSKTKDALKSIYLKEKGSETGYDAYLAKLEAAAKTKKREEIAKTILNEPSPVFTLKDFEGKEVSLASLKGKTVVVDFWATWCGPCIASMPGMNKALAKYKDNENVRFLFVDTWETHDDKLQNAKEFMTKKNYPFYVLMDNDNKMVEDFKVSGIPTKFILDKEGKIRFKTVGFAGNDDDLVEELTTMIELASK